MKLSALVDRPVANDREIMGLTADSREVADGYLFAALAGAQADGARYATDAVNNGAIAIVAADDAILDVAESMVVRCADPRHMLAMAAARFYGRQPETVVAITGTNGKTSTAWFLASIWRKAGVTAGTIGTLGAHADQFDRPLRHTTPDPITLHQTLRDMADANVTHVAMEASSHALAQARLDGVRLRGGGFSNITQDHLDYHSTFDDYFDAKKHLFRTLIGADGFIAINSDGAGAGDVKALATQRGVTVIETGRAGQALRLTSCEPTPQGLAIAVDVAGHAARAPKTATRHLTLSVVGAFQAENALLAAGIAIGCGIPADDALSFLDGVTAPPGRMELAGRVNGASVFVDFAHTPDAVATALRAVRAHAAGRVIVILGAGGDRDQEKRPHMGAAAAGGADLVIVTDDNPRHENPAHIRARVLSGAPDAMEIGDRAAAIRKGVGLLQAGDVLLIAGKGHEQGQIIGATVHPFDDINEARAALGAINPETV